MGLKNRTSLAALRAQRKIAQERQAHWELDDSPVVFERDENPTDISSGERRRLDKNCFQDSEKIVSHLRHLAEQKLKKMGTEQPHYQQNQNEKENRTEQEYLGLQDEIFRIAQLSHDQQSSENDQVPCIESLIIDNDYCSASGAQSQLGWQGCQTIKLNLNDPRGYSAPNERAQPHSEPSVITRLDNAPIDLNSYRKKIASSQYNHPKQDAQHEEVRKNWDFAKESASFTSKSIVRHDDDEQCKDNINLALSLLNNY